LSVFATTPPICFQKGMQLSQHPQKFFVLSLNTLGDPHWHTESSFDRPHIAHHTLLPRDFTSSPSQ
jgi:hypothetical protein